MGKRAATRAPPRGKAKARAKAQAARQEAAVSALELVQIEEEGGAKVGGKRLRRKHAEAGGSGAAPVVFFGKPAAKKIYETLLAKNAAKQLVALADLKPLAP